MIIYVVIINILKIVMTVFACIIAAFLLALVLVLFVPVRYSITMKAGKSLSGSIRATWLLRIFKFLYDIETGKSRTVLKCFHKYLIGSKKNNIKKKAPHNDQPSPDQRPPSVSEPITDESSKEPDENKEPPESQSFSDKMNNIVEKVNHYIDELKRFIDYPDKSLIIKLSLLCLKRLWRGLHPKVLSVEGVVGFHDPSLTGVFIGLICSLSGILGISGSIRIRGNFEEQVMHLDIKAKGKITLWAILWPLILYAISKPIWRIIKGYMKNRRNQRKELQYV